jgi:secondary thiamine-phosphate synthase enzyme
MIEQINFRLNPFSRGFHLITREVLQQLPQLPQTGLLNLFIQHTSASLMLNENADPAVRVDLENSFNHIVRENEPYYTHVDEGIDDMPSHVKVAMMGSSITIPIQDGHLALGTWQGIYLCEFRNNPSGRKIIASIYS